MVNSDYSRQLTSHSFRINGNAESLLARDYQLEDWKFWLNINRDKLSSSDCSSETKAELARIKEDILSGYYDEE